VFGVATVDIMQGHFFLCDASSSNGTMLFLSKPLELDWNKTMHVKIGRTILTLKSKKKWKWTGAAEDGADSDGGEAVTSPRASGLASRWRGPDASHALCECVRLVDHSSTPRSQPLRVGRCAERPERRAVVVPFPWIDWRVPSGFEPSSADRFSAPRWPRRVSVGGGAGDAGIVQPQRDRRRLADARQPGGNLRSSFPDASGTTVNPAPLGLLQGRIADLPRMRNELRQRRDHVLFDLVESLARVDAAAAAPRAAAMLASPRSGSSPAVAASLPEQE